MKKKRFKIFSALLFIPLLAAFGCSSDTVKWDDKTINLGLDGYTPEYLSNSRLFRNVEGQENEIVEDCIIREWTGPLCFDTGENTRFEMRHYGWSQGMGITYSEVYYFDGERKVLIDSSGDGRFSDFALCDGERLCYLVSDGSLRVLEKDGGRTDYENAFDNKKISIGFHTEEIRFFADGNTIFIEKDSDYFSKDEIKINDEKPVIRSSVNVKNAGVNSGSSDKDDKDADWSSTTCQSFNAEGINDIPRYIDNIKNTNIKREETYFQGKKYYREFDILEDGGYLVLDSVSCFSTGGEEGYAVKVYRLECDDRPSYYEICRFENGKLKLLDFSGERSYDDFSCDGERMRYSVGGGFVRILEADGGRTDYKSEQD